MARAKPIHITGRTELLAAIYDPDNLPSAVVHAEGLSTVPYCLHCLRLGDLSDFETFFQEACDNQGVNSDDPKEYENKAQFLLYKFFEDFPMQSYNCVGCARSDAVEVRHTVAMSEEFCTCGTEELA